MQDMTTDTPVQAPGLLNLALEARAPFEYAASLLAAPWLLSAPRGDGHAVIVYPGFLASDFSTRPLRAAAHAGPRRARLGAGAQRRRAHRHAGARAGTPAPDAVGPAAAVSAWWAGAWAARELAKMAPDSVRIVVTLGSPFTGPPQATNAFRCTSGCTATTVRHRACPTS
jgi:hypothetical protein